MKQGPGHVQDPLWARLAIPADAQSRDRAIAVQQLREAARSALAHLVRIQGKVPQVLVGQQRFGDGCDALVPEIREIDVQPLQALSWHERLGKQQRALLAHPARCALCAVDLEDPQRVIDAERRRESPGALRSQAPRRLVQAQAADARAHEEQERAVSER